MTFSSRTPHLRSNNSQIPRALTSKVMVAGAALILMSGGCTKESPTPAQSAPPVVEVADIVRQDVPIQREWVAALDGSTNVTIRSRVQGYLVKQNYSNGAAVKAGEVLFEIDPRPFQAALEQAKADLLKAQAQQINAGLVQNRQLELFNKKVVSEADKDTAVQQNSAAKAAVEAAQAALDQAQLNLDFCKVTSSVDGIAGVAQPGLGDLVGPSGPAMTTVSTLNPIKANIQLSEQDYIKIAPKVNELISANKAVNDNRSLELILADGSLYPLKGTFDSIDRQVNVNTGTIQITTLFPNPENILRPGQFARFRLVTKVEKNAILIPQRAVNEMQGIYQVGVVTPDGRASMRLVKVGPKVGSLWVILEGLEAGEKVIIEGLQKVRPDATGSAAVTVKPWVAPAQPTATTKPTETK